MEGKKPDASCVPLSQVMQKEIYDSVYYIFLQIRHTLILFFIGIYLHTII